MTIHDDLELYIRNPIALALAREYLMKRSTPLRRTPLKRGSSSMSRKPMRRSRPKGQPPERKDEAFKAFVRTLPCCSPGFMPGSYCGARPCDPHHKHGDGKGIKTHDRTCIPLCRYHHSDAEDRRGAFCDFTKQEMRDWHDAESRRVQKLYEEQEG